MHEGCLLLSDIDKGRLQPGKDLYDFTLVNVPDEVPLFDPVDIEVGEDLAVENRNPGFFRRDIDDDLRGHADSLANRAFRESFNTSPRSLDPIAHKRLQLHPSHPPRDPLHPRSNG